MIYQYKRDHCSGTMKNRTNVPGGFFMADILLVDMQSFYASVEKAEAPHLKSRPVIVSGDPERRSGVVLAACPLAKRYGVKNAERLWEAQAKCPDAVIVRPRMQQYIDVSVMITELFERYTDLVEPYSIDEQFLDVTGSRRLFGDPFTIAERIQQAGRIRRSRKWLATILPKKTHPASTDWICQISGRICGRCRSENYSASENGWSII